jgi:hypothetical protein
MAQANAEHPLYFVDGTHPSYTAHPSQGWIRKGQTRELKSNHGRVNVNINGALSWPDRAVVHREAARITSAEMILLFNDLQERWLASSRQRFGSAKWILCRLGSFCSIAGSSRREGFSPTGVRAPQWR